MQQTHHCTTLAQHYTVNVNWWKGVTGWVWRYCAVQSVSRGVDKDLDYKSAERHTPSTTREQGKRNQLPLLLLLPLPLPRLSSFLSDFTTNSAVTYSTATFTTVSALVNTTTTTEGENRWSQKGYLLLLVRLTTSRQVLLSKRKDPRRANGGRRRRRKWPPSRKSANGHDKYQKSNGVP